MHFPSRTIYFSHRSQHYSILITVSLMASLMAYFLQPNFILFVTHLHRMILPARLFHPVERPPPALVQELLLRKKHYSTSSSRHAAIVVYLCSFIPSLHNPPSHQLLLPQDTKHKFVPAQNIRLITILCHTYHVIISRSTSVSHCNFAPDCNILFICRLRRKNYGRESCDAARAGDQLHHRTSA